MRKRALIVAVALLMATTRLAGAVGFAGLATLDVDGDGTTTALTDGLLVLRFLFGFNGATLTTGALDPDCTRCTANDIEAYLALGVPPPSGEFQVNAYTTDGQGLPVAAMDADGDFVVVWGSYEQDGAQYGIFARRFASTGSPQATEFQVNTYTPGLQTNPALAMDDDGDFVIAWSSSIQDGGTYGVFARRFDSAGAPLATEFRVNTYTTSLQRLPVAAMDADGDFVIAWNSLSQDAYYSGIFAQRFDSTGAAQGTEFQVASYTASQEGNQAVAMLANGAFVIAWDAFPDRDGQLSGVFARRFNSSGAPLGAEFQVNSYTAGNQSSPEVAFNGAGDFVVTWRSDGQDGDGYGVFAQRIAASGAAQGGEFQVNTYTPGNQISPDVARDPGGVFAIVWDSAGHDGSGSGVFGRTFAAGGAPVTAEIQINSFTANDQRSGVIAARAGDIVIAWASLSQDGDGYGVFARRFTPPAAFDVDGNGTAGALTDGLLVLRFLFGFTGPALVTGAVGAGCVRCDATTIEPYLQGLL